MDTSNNHSVEDLRRESERTRARLVSTVVELREKVGETAAELKARASPQHIKDEVRSFVREEQRSLVQNVQERIRDNPLQAAAVGALLAYPAWSLLRAIPAPLLLIGAGIWLTGAQGRRTLARAQDKATELAGDKLEAASDMVDQARARAGELVDQAREKIAATGAMVSVAADDGRRMLHDARDAVSTTAASAMQRAKDSVQGAKDSVQGAVGATQNRVDGLASTASHAVEDARSSVQTNVAGMVDRGRQAIGDATTRAVGATRQAGADAAAFVEENTLLVAGVGLAVGAFIGSALPASETEKRLVGKAADAVKQQAGALAARGVQRATEMASEVGNQMAAAAEREGLDKKALKRPVSAAVEGVRNAAEHGLAAAFPEKERSDGGPSYIPVTKPTGTTGSGT